jgi:hypothetical protein
MTAPAAAPVAVVAVVPPVPGHESLDYAVPDCILPTPGRRTAATWDSELARVAALGPADAGSQLARHESNYALDSGAGPGAVVGADGRELGELVRLVEAGDLSSSAAREVLSVITREGGHPAAIVERLGLRQLSEPDALAPMVDAVLSDNPAKVEEYRGGNQRPARRCVQRDNLG